MDVVPLWMPVAFSAIAIVYAMAGFGGGSAYLAVLALVGLPYQAIPQTALLCNVIVSMGGMWHYWRGGHFEFRRILPFFVLSIPMAFIGGRIGVGETTFIVLLGASLFAAGARMLIPQRSETLRALTRCQTWWIGLPIGGALGLLAGVVGVGGGIFLAPVLLLGGWTHAKQTAAAASVFVFVNSVAGLGGQFAKGIYVNEMVIPLIVAAWLGGQIGSRLGAYHLPVIGVRRVLAGIIVIVSVRLVWGAV